MRMGRPVAVLELSEEERSMLQGYVRRRKTAQQLALRSRIVLRCAEGLTNTTVARELGVSQPTVGKWRKRFVAQRLDGLLDEPRPGAPRTVDDAAVEQVITLTLETTPKAATHWSTRDMARHVGLSHTTIGRIWRAFSLQPHRSEPFKLSTDPLFIEKVRDVVGLYMNPPHHALVLCVDEKSQIQAPNRTQPLLPMQPGQVERRTHDYERHGTISLFAALDTATGKVIGRFLHPQRAREFKRFLAAVEAAVPAGLDIHIVCDNYSTHKTPLIKRWMARRPRYHCHFIPTSASWLNQVERWFSDRTERQIKRAAHRSTHELEKAIRAYITASNEAAKPFVWTQSATEILETVARFSQRTLTAHGKTQLVKRTSVPGH